MPKIVSRDANKTLWDLATLAQQPNTEEPPLSVTTFGIGLVLLLVLAWPFLTLFCILYEREISVWFLVPEML